MEFDIEDFGALRQYLVECGHAKADDGVSFRKLLGGVSNRTVRIMWPDGRAWILKQALAKLRVDVDWFSNPERIEVEANALRWLNRWAPAGATPSFVFEDPIHHVLAMKAIPEGHENWKSLLLAGKTVVSHFEQFGFLLGTIHRRSSELRAEVSQKFANTRYFENLRVEPYYLYSARSVPAAAGFLNALAEESLIHKLSLVHGDFSPKNALIHQGKVILLDYEVVHFGEPAFDLGFALSHFLSKAHHLPDIRSRLANAAMIFWQSYRSEIARLDWADALEPRVVQHSLGCLLARVVGKSPLEYLSKREVLRQRDAVLFLIRNIPTTIEALIADFIQMIQVHAKS